MAHETTTLEPEVARLMARAELIELNIRLTMALERGRGRAEALRRLNRAVAASVSAGVLGMADVVEVLS